MKRLLIISLLLLSQLTMASDFKKTGTAGFTFLELPVTARHAALGESSIALSDMNSTAVFSNPASLGFSSMPHSFSASYAPWIADINHFAASYAITTDAGAFALSSTFVDYGTMPRTVKLSGQKVYETIGEFTASSVSLGLTYSKRLTDKFSFGTTLKYVNEKIDSYSATNVLFDGGILFYTGLGSLRIAAALQNFGTDARFKNSTFKMPAVFRLGLAGEVFRNDYTRVTLITEALHPTDSDEKLNFGAEVEFSKLIVLRGGYKVGYDEENLSFGVGLIAPNDYPVGVDFSYTDFGRLGNILRFTLQAGIL